MNGEKTGAGSPLCPKCGLWSEKKGRCKLGGCHTPSLYKEGRLRLEHAAELRERYGRFYVELNAFLGGSERNREFFNSTQGREAVMRPKKEADRLLEKYLEEDSRKSNYRRNAGRHEGYEA